MRNVILGAVALAVVGLTGMSAQAADGRLGVELIERNNKVVILNIIKGSGAEGVLEPGDILYKVGTTKISNIQDALNAKASAANNSDIPFIILRKGEYYDFNGRFEKGQPYSIYSKPMLRKQ